MNAEGRRPVVLFAIGNPSRGDDALGPEIYGRLLPWLENAGLIGNFDLYEDFQLQIEHALDLKGRALALFIDAGDHTPGPYTFTRAWPSEAVAHTSHALAPDAVLQVYRQIEGEDPPPAYVLCVRGEAFALGEPLSPTARQHLEAAWALLTDLCRAPTPSAWAMRTMPAVAG